MSKQEEKCRFCDISRNGLAPAWQSSLFYAIFDTHPVSPGHTLIIPKRHAVFISDLTQEEWQDLGGAIRCVIDVIESTYFTDIYNIILTNGEVLASPKFLKAALNHPRINTKPDAYNHGVNDGKASGRTVDHFHWHIIPRYQGDVADPRGGIRHVIPELANWMLG